MMFSILSSLRSVALLALSIGLLMLHPYNSMASASPTLDSRMIAPWSGKGNLMVHQGGEINGCINAQGQWIAIGGCATFSAAPQGTSATQLTTSAGQCGFDLSWNLVCEVGNPNGPENWHVSLLSFLDIFNGLVYVQVFGNSIWQGKLKKTYSQTWFERERNYFDETVLDRLKRLPLMSAYLFLIE